MTDETKNILDNLANTLLYEGYSLFPYHRSAIKNQKPIPFGIVYPEAYKTFNPQALAEMQAQCLVEGDENLLLNISLLFLHLIKNNQGWQTIERKIKIENIHVGALLVEEKKIPFHFDGESYHPNEILPIRGIIMMEAVQPDENIFRVGIRILNGSIIQNPKNAGKDETLLQSFLSTHIILNSGNGKFISSQSPPERIREMALANKNIGTWQIMIDQEDTTILFSPIIVYDYPKIHPKSKGDLFDSTEIEEALMLHFAVMSDDEKECIANSDEKLRAMLNKVREITPEELVNLHGGMYENVQMNKT